METARINMEDIYFEYPSDLLDAYCYEQFGHTDWEQIADQHGNIVVRFKRVKEKIQ
jgi:hypothetical protein